MTKKLEGADRDAFIDRIARMAKDACKQARITHPEDISAQLIIIAEIVAEWESEN